MLVGSSVVISRLQAPAPFRQIVYDDGCCARDLDEDEQRFLETVCSMLGHELEDVA